MRGGGIGCQYLGVTNPLLGGHHTSSRSCFVLVLAGIGLLESANSANLGVVDRPHVRDSQDIRLLTRFDHTAYDLAMSGKYLRAQELYQHVCAGAKALGDTEWAGRCLTALGSCQFAMFQYRKALDSYIEARRFAEAGEDWANLGSLNANISGLFLQMGDLDAAAQSAQQALADFNRKDFPGGRSRCLIQLAAIRARQDHINESAALIGEAVDCSSRNGDLATVAEAWDHLGEEYLTRGQLAAADVALTESFRLRKLFRLSLLDSSYLHLGRLRLAQRDLRSALQLLNEAIVWQNHPGSLVNAWSPYLARAQVHLAEGRTAAAFADSQKALRLARLWRVEVLPTDFTRISSEGELQQIYSLFIETANELCSTSGRCRELARESFRAAEENRAASLHALLHEPSDWRDALPAEYWETLAQLHAVEVARLHSSDASLQERNQQLRSKLLLFEAQAGSNVSLTSDRLFARTQENLPGDAALFSFHLGERKLFLWAISRDHFRMYRLPIDADLSACIARFSEDVRTHELSAELLGRQLYERLFGHVDKAFRDKPHWILALDEPLFQIPFGALVVNVRRSGPTYLAERHSICITTGAVMLTPGLQQKWRTVLSGRFLGVGDPIYNLGDPRWNKRSAERPGLLSESRTNGPNLTRLVGSAREVESCAREWDPHLDMAVLLEGLDASPIRLRDELRAGASVVHIAAHFLQANVPPRHSMIALSLTGPGDPQLLSPLEITRFKIHVGIVVLSGCSSGSADVLPGSGLMGLTRAWLAAGARAVVASHWPTPDDTGPLFVCFYKHLREKPDAGPAAALQEAQSDFRHAGGWRSDAQYWATYFVVGDQ
jgi:CHAT domain-containing protein